MKSTRLLSIAALSGTLILGTGTSALAGATFGGARDISPLFLQLGQDEGLNRIEGFGFAETGEPCQEPNPWADVEDYAPAGLVTSAPWLPFRAGLFMMGPLLITSTPSVRAVVTNTGIPLQCGN